MKRNPGPCRAQKQPCLIAMRAALHVMLLSQRLPPSPLHASPRKAGDLVTRSQVRMLAAPKRGSKVDSYQTVAVLCNGCNERLFRYKKKNGMKSNLVKCYIERICEDTAGLLASRSETAGDATADWQCPACQATFARTSLIHGRPALKLVGGKVRMAKK